MLSNSYKVQIRELSKINPITNLANHNNNIVIIDKICNKTCKILKLIKNCLYMIK